MEKNWGIFKGLIELQSFVRSDTFPSSSSSLSVELSCGMILQRIVSFQSHKDSGRLNATLPLMFPLHLSPWRLTSSPPYSIASLHWIPLFPIYASPKLVAMRLRPFYCCLLRHRFPLFLQSWVKVMALMTSVFQMWNLSSPCGQIACTLHLCCPQCHESRVTNSMHLTLGHCWLLTGELFVIENVVQTSLTLPSTPWCFRADRILLLARPGWYHIPSSYCPTGKWNAITGELIICEPQSSTQKMCLL